MSNEKVADWFAKYAVWVATASGRADIPVPGSEDGNPYWDVLKSAFRRHGVTKDIAFEATNRVLEGNPFPDTMRASIIQAFKVIFAERAKATGSGPVGSREAAMFATPEDCECGRSGIVTRFRHQPAGDGIGRNARGFRFPCYCTCPVGRWIREQHEADDRRGFVDLASYPQLHLRPVDWSDVPDNPYRYHPDQWDAYHHRPMPVTLYRRDDALTLARARLSSRRRYGRPTPPLTTDPTSTAPVTPDGRISGPEDRPVLPDKILESGIVPDERMEYQSDPSEPQKIETEPESYDYL